MTEPNAQPPSDLPPSDRPAAASPWAAPGSAAAPPSAYAPSAYAPPGYQAAAYPQPPAYAPPPAYGPPPGYPPPGYPPQGYPPPGYPQGGYPQPGYPAAPVQPQPAYAFPQHAGVAMASPERIDEVAGTNFGIAYAAVPKIASGQAIGSMIAGIGSVVIAFVELGFGLGGSAAGWGPRIAGAFGILALLLGAAALVGSRLARRAIRRSAGTAHGLRIAFAGMILGTVGLAITVIGFAGSLLATYT